jgi:ubiquitin carboxyl-terminal hydrolase 8
MAKFSNKKELQFLSFEELSNHAKFDFKNINFNSAQICNSLLKMFDKGNMLYSSGDEENAYLLLMKFFEAYVKLRASKFYKEDKAFVENMITGDKLNKTISNLENLKESLIYRYKEREAKIFIEKSSLNVDTRRSDLKLPTAGGLNQIVEKKFIRPTEFTELITKSDLKVLIIDTRSKNEFDYSHMNLSILLPDGKNRPQIINVPNELIENVAWKLEETLKKQDIENEALSVSKIFANRKEYDYLILFDKDSTMNGIKADSKLSILKRAVFDFEPNDKLKNEPLVLDGGWNEWLNIYPGYSSSSNSNNLQREFIKSSNYGKKTLFWYNT